MADTSDYVTDTGDADLAHDPQIAEEDWDRELNNQPIPASTSQPFNLQASNGMVTITPAGYKARFSKVPPVDVRVEWVYGGNVVEMFSSYDDFVAPITLSSEIDPTTGETVHAALFKMPPGRYLIRYKVDGDWLIDDNQEVVFSLGNEYNSLVVKDPNAPEEEESDDSDWGDIDEALPEQFISGTASYQDLLVNIGPNASGMVTISPAALLEATKGMSTTEKDKFLGPAKTRERQPSMAWDSQRRAFVMADNDHEDAGAGAGAAGSDSGAGLNLTEDQRKERERQRRRHKKKKQRERKRRDGSSRGGRAADMAFVKEELVKREREWREAWIIHELKAQELREKEKAALREQWKEEREQWINKIKNYANDANTLRTQLNELQLRLERAESGKQLFESDYQRKKETLDHATKQIAEEADKAKKEAKQLREELRVLKAESQAQQTAFDEAKAELTKLKSEREHGDSHSKIAVEAAEKQLAEVKSTLTAQLKALREEYESKLSAQASVASAGVARVEVEAKVQEVTVQLNNKWAAEVQQLKEAEAKAGRELDLTKASLTDAQSENKKLSDELKTRRAEFEQQLTQAREEVKLQQNALKQDSDSVQQQLNARLTALTKEFEDKQKALLDQAEELKTVQKQLAEASRQAAALQKDLDTERTDAATKVAAAEQRASAAEQSSQSTSKTLSLRVEELSAALAEKTKSVERLQSDVTEAQAAVAEAKRQIVALEAEKAAVSLDVQSARKEAEGAASQIKTLSARVDAVTAERTKLEAEFEHHKTELDTQLTALRADVRAKQGKLDETASQLEHLQTESKIKEANWQREKQEAERELAVIKKGRAALVERLNEVSATAKQMRKGLDGFKEEQLTYTARMKNDLDENMKFLINALGQQSEMLDDLARKYKKEMAERRKYFNLVQELRGNIRVYCRSRPMLPHDEKKGTKQAAQFPDETSIRVATEKRTNDYEFDRVFAPAVNNQLIFNETKWLVQSCMDGYNVCIFAYGQTGSGKTHTMSGTETDRGVNYNSLRELFRIRDERKGDFSYKISVSMLEIYNETINDLLDKDKDKAMKIHRGTNGMYVENLSELPVHDESDIVRIMKMGESNRSVGVTNMNEHSSRSHSLLSIKVEGQNLIAGITYFGKLHLIDLAGSERISKSMATGQRLKEAQAINKSLSALGNVIEALQHKQSHVPFRDSKLTYLLQDSLGGNAKTLMFINVSPTEDDAEESFCSLNFASRVRRVELGSAVQTKAIKAAEDTGADDAEPMDDDEPADDDGKAAPKPAAGAAPAVKKATPASTTAVKKPAVPAAKPVSSVKPPIRK